ncbi:hypothetical protein [Psychrobacter vallis]|uniref:hypothetical protein n=1 Tax=Psychrobacter vallis TaxID=248451 RepID=UPI00191997D0|nr:hypothetical protein [Psychrobacter vallis]
MQFINVLRRPSQSESSNNSEKGKIIYSVFHPRNGDVLERENDKDKFEILRYTDDCDPSALMTTLDILDFMKEIQIVMSESENDNEMSNHLKEIIFMCKLCIWNIDEYYLEITPFGTNINYPTNLL